MLATFPADTPGVVVPHLNGLNGVFARGSYWWRIGFDGGVQGWVRQDDLLAGPGWANSLKALHDKLLRIVDDG
jgi:hypothetical protein